MLGLKTCATTAQVYNFYLILLKKREIQRHLNIFTTVQCMQFDSSTNNSLALTVLSGTYFTCSSSRKWDIFYPALAVGSGTYFTLIFLQEVVHVLPCSSCRKWDIFYPAFPVRSGTYFTLFSLKEVGLVFPCSHCRKWDIFSHPFCRKCDMLYLALPVGGRPCFTLLSL